MARVTIQDSLAQVDNHFQLIHIAAARAKQLQRGAYPLVPPNGDKPTVIALREIAAGFKVDEFNRSYEEARRHELENQ
jgi:DNA-directed RNA polymerase subunit omega